MSNRAAGTGFDLHRIGEQIGVGRFGLRMRFWIAADFNVEIIACLMADEGDEFAGVFEFTKCAVAAGQIAAQGNDALDAGFLE